jgi:hypothetical protein
MGGPFSAVTTVLTTQAEFQFQPGPGEDSNALLRVFFQSLALTLLGASNNDALQELAEPLCMDQHQKVNH